MICKISIARDGFINCKSNIIEPTNKNNFVEVLESFFDFEEKDLLGFDGVNCVLENAQDPNSSIFIYTNDTGSFLYQIQKTIPQIHKNKLLWNCSVLQLDTISNIQNVINGGSAYIELINGIAPNYHEDEITKSKAKQNFTPTRKLQLPFGAYVSTTTEHSIYTLKIKCYVDPTNSGLTSNSPDGSFVFLFPIQANSNFFSTELTNGSTTAKLQTIVSTYSKSIKSIELLPFLPNQSMVTTSTIGSYEINFEQSTSEVLKVDIASGYQFTELGLFMLGASVMLPTALCENAYIGNELTFDGINRRLALGGGVVGFVRTPLGEFPLDFENIPGSLYSHDQQTKNIIAIPYDEGFAIVGNFYCRIPPHYINFYTDSSGEIFINQQTTYQYENKVLELQRQQKQKQSGFDLATTLVGGLVSAGVGTLTGNPFLSAGGLQSAVGSVFGGITNYAQAGIDYNSAKQILDAKIENETLLAKMTGKQVNGNVGVMDFLKYLCANTFEIIVEMNYEEYQDFQNMPTAVQTNFDYSVSYEENSSFYGLTIENETTVSLFTRLQKIFGLLPNDYEWDNNENANYNIIFKIKNRTNNHLFTNNLILPIRF